MEFYGFVWALMILGFWSSDRRSTCTALTPDGLSLLTFKAAVSSDPADALSEWSEDDEDPCRWPGISCANISGTPRVVGVAVSGKNLSGYIPSELGTLLYLRRLNLHSNRLSGHIPSELFNATSLHSLFLYDNNLSGSIPPSLCDLPRLQNLDLSKNSIAGTIPLDLRHCRQLQRLLLAKNHLYGEIPAGIWPDMASLSQLDLSSNQFNGSIPTDIGELGSLSGTLNLSHNHFSGEIPSSLGRLPADVSLDLRFNNLSGEIPQTGSLSNQGPTAFLNNPLLCGFPLQNPCQDDAAPAPPGRQIPSPTTDATPEKRGLRPGLIILISIADAVGVALIGLIAVYVYWRVKDQDNACSCTGRSKLGGEGKVGICGCWRAGIGSEEEESDKGEGGGGEGDLVAIDKGFVFELDELLRASAYVLGKSGLGIVYKVVLGNGIPVAVRRLGEGGAQRYKEFSAEAQAIGRVKHPNIVRLRAYYWANDEKLLITDFISNGNLATALRGRAGQASLSWTLRLKIMKGAARGLAHLHECNPRKFVHGDVKPSNILLDVDYNAYISDFGLIRLISIAGNEVSSSSSGGFMGGALPVTKPAPLDRPNPYRAPEARSPNARPSQKSDIYSFGLVLFEMVTGKSPEFSSPSTPSTSSAGVDGIPELVRWVRRCFDEAKPLSEILDPVLLRELHAKKEVLGVFHVALSCTETDPEARPRMKTVSEILDRIGGA
ncbi:hypothetical protein J5N97_021017 [Dioscorea zingiberensis]|uniref:Protein kinase domain-containing protein n=1 Tax=Dioscorea zingiberensis TaxID=325984 RepID=A0A9D5CIA6_9LILI|nr:hypothetical protein J5N97_021017 [Dioscorea zingiberensis]